jgi:flagellar biosynthesis protein FlhG
MASGPLPQIGAGQPSADRPLAGHSLCVASGKGGVGKTVVSAALAQLFARLGRTLLLDGDLGVGNAHLLQDVQPARHLGHLAEGSAAVGDLVISCGPGLDLLAAGTGLPHMSDLDLQQRGRIARGLVEIEEEYRTSLVDSAAGVSEQTLSFAVAADATLLITTPDVTALTDAYAFFKVLRQRRPGAPTFLVVNRARDAREAERATARFVEVSGRFLGDAPRVLGWLPEDASVRLAVNQRRSVLRHEPRSAVSRALADLFARLERALAPLPAGGLGRGLLGEGRRGARLGA